MRKKRSTQERLRTKNRKKNRKEWLYKYNIALVKECIQLIEEHGDWQIENTPLVELKNNNSQYRRLWRADSL